MVNRNSHGHGIKVVRATQPSAKMSKRTNKAKARVRAEARQTALAEAFAKGN
jgi:hypothetical protein